MWILVPRTRIKPMSPASEGWFLTTAPPGKSQVPYIFIHSFFSLFFTLHSLHWAFSKFIDSSFWHFKTILCALWENFYFSYVYFSTPELPQNLMLLQFLFFFNILYLWYDHAFLYFLTHSFIFFCDHINVYNGHFDIGCCRSWLLVTLTSSFYLSFFFLVNGSYLPISLYAL